MSLFTHAGDISKVTHNAPRQWACIGLYQLLGYTRGIRPWLLCVSSVIPVASCISGEISTAMPIGPDVVQLLVVESRSFIAVVGSPSMPSLFGDGIPMVFRTHQAIKIDSSMVWKRINKCKYSIIGRVILSKCKSPWPLPKLKVRLASIWGLQYLSWRA